MDEPSNSETIRINNPADDEPRPLKSDETQAQPQAEFRYRFPQQGKPRTRRRPAAADAQMQLLMIDDPLIRFTLGERCRELCQELTRKDQTPFESRLVNQVAVAWCCQAGLKHRLNQPDLSQRHRHELRRQYNIALEHFERELHELETVRRAIITTLATSNATQTL